MLLAKSNASFYSPMLVKLVSSIASIQSLKPHQTTPKRFATALGASRKPAAQPKRARGVLELQKRRVSSERSEQSQDLRDFGRVNKARSYAMFFYQYNARRRIPLEEVFARLPISLSWRCNEPALRSWGGGLTYLLVSCLA